MKLRSGRVAGSEALWTAPGLALELALELVLELALALLPEQPRPAQGYLERGPPPVETERPVVEPLPEPGEALKVSLAEVEPEAASMAEELPEMPVVLAVLPAARRRAGSAAPEE